MAVIHRLKRGDFSGFVERIDEGPYRGWFNYYWNAGGIEGGTRAIGKNGAIAGLHAACLTYFRNRQQEPPHHR